MKLIACPLNGLRPAEEFVYAGELRSSPDPARCSDVEWARYVFNRSGVPGVKREWWCHSPSGYWFILERDTLTDAIVASYDISTLAGPPR
jgi:sarcosine oxidase, subunit delta